MWGVCGLEVCGCERQQARFLKLMWVQGGFKFCGCTAGADKKFQPAQDSSAQQEISVSREV